jgi:hypothetical protein
MAAPVHMEASRDRMESGEDLCPPRFVTMKWVYFLDSPDSMVRQ